MALVDRRYAEALLNIALEDGKLDQYAEQLGTAAEVLSERDTVSFLKNPKIGAEFKKITLKKAFSEGFEPKFINFVMLLAEKGRTDCIAGISKEYSLLADRKRGILHMTVYSAQKLDDGQLTEIKSKYSCIYGASSVVAEVVIDDALIGGVKIKIGDRLIDGTIKGKINSLKELLID